jgi:D-beta-D-heptose 7-phosphate kinase/D-beta-D-heptose 1-phosphate adenosyltransferase
MILVTLVILRYLFSLKGIQSQLEYETHMKSTPIINLSIPPFQSAHILIIGDIMLDRYWSGETSRISPEAPVPVVRIRQQEERPGGAGNVALNVKSLGAKVTLIGMTGTDEAAHHLLKLLTDAGIQCQFNQLAHLPTVTKLRVLSHHQQLIRLDFEEPMIDFDTQWVPKQMQKLVNSVDLIILSDYGKGVLVPVAELIQLARAANKPVLVDPKGRNFQNIKGQP